MLLLHKYTPCQTIYPEFCLKNIVTPTADTLQRLRDPLKLFQGLIWGWTESSGVVVMGCWWGRFEVVDFGLDCHFRLRELLWSLDVLLPQPSTLSFPLTPLSKILSCPRKFWALWTEAWGTALSQEGKRIERLRIPNKVFLSSLISYVSYAAVCFHCPFHM